MYIIIYGFKYNQLHLHIKEPKEIVLAIQITRKRKGHRSIISTLTKKMYYIPLLKSLSQFLGNKFISDEVSFTAMHNVYYA